MKQEKLTAKQIQDLLAKVNPRYYSNEHVDAIVRGDPQQAIELLKTVKLSYFEELELVEKAPVSVVEAYIKMVNGLSPASEIALIKRGDDKLIQCFIDAFDHGFSKEAEPEFIRTHQRYSLNRWREYMHHNELPSEAQKVLVDSHDIDLICIYLENHSLSEDAAVRLVKTYTIEEITKLISHNRFYLAEGAEACLIESADENTVRSYILKHQLWERGQTALIERGNNELIMYYLNLYKSLQGEAIIKLVERFRYDEIAECMEHFSLPEKAQIAIIEKSNKPALISLMTEKCRLEPRAEIAFIRGKDVTHEMIMRYIGKWSLAPDSRVALLKRGNSEEIKACIERKIFFGYQEELLIKRGKKDEIELYLSIYHPEWNMPE